VRIPLYLDFSGMNQFEDSSTMHPGHFALVEGGGDRLFGLEHGVAS
jgi:hypothetical protein